MKCARSPTFCHRIVAVSGSGAVSNGISSNRRPVRRCGGALTLLSVLVSLLYHSDSSFSFFLLLFLDSFFFCFCFFSFSFSFKKKKEEERRRRTLQQKQVSFTIARTRTFCYSRAWNPLTPTLSIRVYGGCLHILHRNNTLWHLVAPVAPFGLLTVSRLRLTLALNYRNNTPGG